MEIDTLLEEKTYTDVEWNKEIMPRVADGTLKRKDLPKGDYFLMIGMQFKGIVVDTDGTEYECTGWHKGIVQVRKA